MTRLPVKRLPDGRALANLGCGARTHPGFNNLDFGAYARLRRRPWLAGALRAVGFLSDARWAALQAVDPAVVVWDMRRGLPWPDAAFDAVYHAHVLEHLDRAAAPAFLAECRRVLRPGGVLRVAVPDLEQAAAAYAASLQAAAAGGPAALEAHGAAVEGLYEQFVRTVTADSLRQKPWVRAVEHLVRRDPARTGELHRWMYDRVSLPALLREVGFREPQRRGAADSAIEGWAAFELDADDAGRPHLPGTLYVEALR